MKKLWKILIITTCLFAVSITAHSAEAANDSFARARLLDASWGYTIFCEPGTVPRTDYFYTVLPDDGYACFGLGPHSGGSHEIRLYDEKRREIWRCSTSSEESAQSPYIGLAAGTKIYASVYSSISSRYTVVFGFTKAKDFEKETNNSFKDANLFETGVTVSGNLFPKNDSDYYKIVVPEEAYVTMVMNRSNAEHHYVAIYDQNKSLLWKKDAAYEQSFSSPSFKVPAGYVYIKITGSNLDRYRFRVKLLKASHKVPNSTKILGTYYIKNGIKLAWKRPIGNVSGYQIQYTDDRLFKEKIKTVRIKSPETTSVRITGLKECNTYYIRVRTFYTVNNKTYYSHWSNTAWFTT